MKKALIAAIAFLATVSCGTATGVSRADTDYDNEGVSIGYGRQSRRDSNFAVGSVKIDERTVSSYETILDYLKARVPGIDVQSNGTVRIRGENSLNLNTDALILVDEIEVRDLLSVNPNDVYSVDVLKDASASAYGARGANGVVLITTKGAHQANEAEAAAAKAKREAARQAKKGKQ